MPALDLRTIILILGLVSVLQAVVLVLYYLVGPRYDGMLLWVWAGVANALGFVLVLLRDRIPDFVSVLVANGALFVGLVLLHRGINRFVGRPRPLQERLVLALVVAAGIAFIPLTYVYPSVSARTAALSLTAGIVYLLTGWALARATPPALRLSYWFTACVFIGYGVWQLGRGLLTAAAAPLPGLYTPTDLQIAAFLVVVVALLLYTAGLVAMATQRLLYDSQRAQAAERTRLEADLVAREQAEAVLRRSRLQLEQALWGADLGLWDWHLPSGTMDANEQLARLLGASLADFVPLVEMWRQHTHPDDLPAVDAAFTAAIAGQMDRIEAEYRIRHRDGSWRWQLCRGRAVEHDASGAVVRLVGVTQDITARKQAEEALRERETMLRAIGDNLPDAMVYQLVRRADGQEVFTHVSAGVERISGITPDQVYAGTSAFDRLHEPDDLQRYQAAVAHSEHTLTTFAYELRKRLPSGELRWSQIRSQPRRLAAGDVVWDGIEVDITGQKRAEEALRQRIDELLALNQIAQALTSWTDLAHGLESVGAVLCQLFAADGVAVWAHEPPDNTLSRLIAYGNGISCTDALRVPLASTAMGETALTGASVTVSALAGDHALIAGCERASATSGALPVMLVPLRVRNQPVGLLCIRASDAGHVYTPSDSALAQTIGGLLSSALANARLFAQAQSLAAERERRRLARELHDSVSQALFAANRTAEVLPQIWELDPDEGRAALTDLRRFTTGALAEMRALLVELRPRALAEAPLHETLAYLAPVLAAKDEVQVVVDLAPVPVLPTDVQVALYRIAQEALNNVGKHAQAQHVALQLHAVPAYRNGAAWRGTLTLTVRDDGRGYAVAAAPTGRMGLTSMRERAADIGATLVSVSRPSAGTEVMVVWRGEVAAPTRSQA